VASVLNVSAYLFTPIDEPAALRDRLQSDADAAGVKGTIIVAGEGVNVFLAGTEDAVRGLLAQMTADPRLAGLRAKESWSEEQPFGRMRVRVKREIIRMDRPEVSPADRRAPAVDPETLRTWLDRGTDDAGREVVMLDTRNAFEVDYGAFRDALDWRIERFTQFPDAAATALADLSGKTVVSYCTGGIRCEKAALHLRDLGVEAYQLDGGILGWFEKVGGEHWDGDCFVFDGREAVSPDLSPRRR
jgi:UPF0176 protein